MQFASVRRCCSDSWTLGLRSWRRHANTPNDKNTERVIASLRATMGDGLESAMAHGAEWTEAAAVAAALDFAT